MSKNITKIICPVGGFRDTEDTASNHTKVVFSHRKFLLGLSASDVPQYIN